MKKRNQKRGFTMAEMLIVVAIIGVLSAVAFVAVTQHQRDLERLDRDSVARELFIAAQNHLTMAKSQGYLGLTGDITGIKEDEENDNGVYYFAVYKGSGFSTDGTPKSLLDLMLPFGAIEESVRAGGSYIIRYHYDTATVMDVFYCSTDERYGCDLSKTEAAALTKMCTDYGEGKESARRNFNGKVLGWYGGATVETLDSEELGDPEIVVENGAKLVVYVANGTRKDGTSNPSTSSIQVVIKGVISQAEKVFTLKPAASGEDKDSRIVDDAPVTIDGSVYGYSIILDDITTADMHFADIAADIVSDKYPTGFIPGEDITIQAKAFDNTKISNIGYSAEITVNSLFERIETGEINNSNNSSSVTAFINNIRHLENLDRHVSNVSITRTEGSDSDAIYFKLQQAVQTSDMSWSKFVKDIKKQDTDPDPSVYQHTIENSDTILTSAGCYLPINPDTDNALSYDGQNHSISDIKVNYAGDAGLFGKLLSDSSVSNLELINFNITSTSGNAGALVGTLEQKTKLADDKYNVSNVLAINDTNATAVNVSAAGNTDDTKGHAGGLIGAMIGEGNLKGYGIIEKSAASLIVSSAGGDAGGLIGQTTGGKVSACYSGGHTTDAAYSTTAYNVSAANGNAGGLIGAAESSTSIDHSYSTCSVTGKVAGGFVASASAAISYCYATGLVQGVPVTEGGTPTVSEGAFAYATTPVSYCYYLEIINERLDNAEYPYLPAIGASPNVITGFAKIDESAEEYNAFVGAQTGWKPASAYDPKLIEYYGGKYNLQTVERLLGATLKKDENDTTVYFVATHYGDWPAPEIFVVNEKSSTTPSNP